MGLTDFFQRYFIQPLQTGEGYNIYNTLVYGLLLLLGALGILKLLRRLGVKMDRGLFWASLPFLFLAALLRALEQFALSTGEGPLPVSSLFLTPGIYLLVATLALTSLLVGSYFQRGVPAMVVFGSFLSGLALILFLQTFFQVSSGGVAYASGKVLQVRPLLFLQILLVALIATALAAGALHRWKMATRENALILGGFAFESSSVALAALTLGYTAEQPLTRSLVGIHPIFYLVFKVSLIVAILYYVERDLPAGDEYHWLTKFLLLVLGLPMGIHNSLQILLGV